MMWTHITLLYLKLPQTTNTTLVSLVVQMDIVHITAIVSVNSEFKLYVLVKKS